jgi:hypothetical protein
VFPAFCVSRCMYPACVSRTSFCFALLFVHVPRIVLAVCLVFSVFFQRFPLVFMPLSGQNRKASTVFTAFELYVCTEYTVLCPMVAQIVCV